MRVKCLAQEHNTMSPARARTWTTRSGVKRTNHEATAPPDFSGGRNAEMPRERPLELGENQEQTQLICGTGPESNLGKTLGARREPATNSTHIWNQTGIKPGLHWWEASAPRRVLPPL